MKKNIHKSLSEFAGLTDANYCPYGSGKKYGDCCKSGSEGVKHKVHQFKLENMISK